jgi:hypothetical protein
VSDSKYPREFWVITDTKGMVSEVRPDRGPLRPEHNYWVVTRERFDDLRAHHQRLYERCKVLELALVEISNGVTPYVSIGVETPNIYEFVKMVLHKNPEVQHWVDQGEKVDNVGP